MLGFIVAAEDSTRIILPHTAEFVLGSIAFAILLAALLKGAFPKMQQTLAARTQRIRDSIESADNSKQEAERLLNEYRQQLAEARGDAQKIIDEAKRTAEAMRQDLIRRAEQEAQELVQRAKADVAGERDRAMQSLRSAVGDLSLQLAARVIERELSSPEAQRALVERSIDELSALGNGQGQN
ncbi:MAG: F0F1 ATP synthase subunit B [Actinomycetota bacterium]|nr:F0F1 ATP synthase subunit B [Actinomycetota bacterium]